MKNTKNSFFSREIADIVNGTIEGSVDCVISGIAGIKEAGINDITFLANSKYAALLNETKAAAIIVSSEVHHPSKTLIKVNNPSLAFAKVVDLFVPNALKHPQGICSQAAISSNAVLGKNTAVGAFAVIEQNVRIGDNTIIYPGVYLGHDVSIGSNCIIYSNVSIRERCQIGNNVIIHCGAVVGSDGFGFTDDNDGLQVKIPQVGIVILEDNVELGANVTIDRARFGKTLIGKGTKIDNLVQIAHNVEIGQNCIIVAQAGIAGSSKLGNRVILAGQAGVVGHITIGDNVSIGAQSGVSKSIAANTIVSGYPAKPHAQALRVNACVQNLPDLVKKIHIMEKNIQQLQENRNKE